MPLPRCTEDEFIAIWKELGSPTLVAERLGIASRNVQDRRRAIEARRGIKLETWNDQSPKAREYRSGAVVSLVIDSGVVLVGSDAHFWPGIVTTAWRAFTRFARELKPVAVVLNGDILDGASISRHASIGREKKPSLIEELRTCRERIDELLDAAPNAKKFWPGGNHDLRFETRLANVAGEYKEVPGVHLKDHFPEWVPCWRLDINDDVVIKHRYRSGIHAAHNNTVNAGKTIVTGHLHSPKVVPFTDLRGTRFGVDSGCLADADGPQFEDYTEAGPKNWISGFVVLTFRDGQLMWPELVTKWDEDHVCFRGELIRV